MVTLNNVVAQPPVADNIFHLEQYASMFTAYNAVLATNPKGLRIEEVKLLVGDHTKPEGYMTVTVRRLGSAGQVIAPDRTDGLDGMYVFDTPQLGWTPVMLDYNKF